MQAAGAQGPRPELPGEAAEVSRDHVVQDLLELGGVFGFILMKLETEGVNQKSVIG